MVIENWAFGKHLLKNKWSEPVTSRKMTGSLWWQWQNLSFQTKIRILENISITINLTASQYLMTLLYVIFKKTLYEEIYKHVEDLHN